MSYQETIKQRIGKNKGRMLTSLEKHQGNIKRACRELGIYRSTFYRWFRKDPIFSGEVVKLIECCKKYHGNVYLQELANSFEQEDTAIRAMLEKM